MKKYKLSIVIGRFQPVHNGHLQLFNQASKLAPEVLVLVGSSFRAPDIENPFNHIERTELIRNVNQESDSDFYFGYLTDVYYDDDKWALQVTKIVEKFGYDDSEVILVGHKKDRTTYYLDMFPQYAYHEVDTSIKISATDVRKEWFRKSLGNFDIVKDKLPIQTVEFLNRFYTEQKERYLTLSEEYVFIEDYKRIWERSPYPVIFQTVDAVVVRSNYILMIKRRASPGKGLWALPGGFLNYNEQTLNGALRELKEETKLDIPDKVLIGSLKGQKRFDHPKRSLRGRTITEAFYFKLPNGKIDKVKGSDDAAKARWIHLSKLKPEEIFEDHMSIIKHFTGI